MLSISNLAAEGDCFKHDPIEGLEPAAWLGIGADFLGLEGRLDEEQFGNLRDGLSPDGSGELVPNAEQKNCRAHREKIFSAPKSISFLNAFGSKRREQELIKEQKFAMKAVFEFKQTHPARKRRGQPGK